MHKPDLSRPVQSFKAGKINRETHPENRLLVSTSALLETHRDCIAMLLTPSVLLNFPVSNLFRNQIFELC